jgi:hypothetical protein
MGLAVVVGLGLLGCGPPAPARPGPDELNDNEDRSDPRIKRGLYDNLVKEGLAFPLWDVRMLVSNGVVQTLAVHGFLTNAPLPDGTRTYDLGAPAIHQTGQRVVLAPDGKVALSSFSQPVGDGGHSFAIVEVVQQSVDGKVENQLATFD